MLAIALVLVVPTIAIAWWSRCVARRTKAVGWVMPVVLGAWVLTTTLVGVSLASAFRDIGEVEPSARSATLAARISAAGSLVVAMVAVLSICGVLTALAARRNDADLP